MLYVKFVDDRENRRAVQHSTGIALLSEGVWREYGVSICENDIITDGYGKPFLPDYPHIKFSISHCSGLVLCFICGSDCGADAENIRAARDSVARRIMSADEMNMYESKQGRDKDIFFTSLWTLKEAYGKAVGKGISAMKSVSFHGSDGEIQSTDSRFAFKQFLCGEYIIALCSENPSDLSRSIGEEYYPF